MSSPDVGWVFAGNAADFSYHQHQRESLSGYLKLENLFGRDPHGLAGIGEITHRRAGTRAGLEWNTDVAHREFDPAEGLHHHYFVQPAEMADAENLAIDLIEPCAER